MTDTIKQRLSDAGLRVKPLEWVPEDGNSRCHDAEGAGVFYRVLIRYMSDAVLRVNGSHFHETPHDDEAEAKEYAQRLEDARILAALEVME